MAKRIRAAARAIALSISKGCHPLTLDRGWRGW